MIRKNIIKNKNDKQRYFLNDSWRIEMPAVVRTPFYGNNCSEYFGYVVTYSEMEQAYHLSLPMYNDVYFLEEKDCNLMSVLIETGGEYTSSSIVLTQLLVLRPFLSLTSILHQNLSN